MNLTREVLINPSSPRMPDKSACALNARKGGPKGERSESSRGVHTMDTGLRRYDGVINVLFGRC